MRQRRYRPTFFLRLVILLAALAAAFVAFAIANALNSGYPQLIAIGTGALIIVLSEMGLLELFELLMERRAERGVKPPSRLWFADAEDRTTLESERLKEDSKDNPTLR